MLSRLKKAAVASVAVLVAVLAAAQLVRPAHTNLATNSARRCMRLYKQSKGGLPT